jgi:hypothetical protein
MMSLANIPTYSGGCQCGAVRFRIEGALHRPSICHCRMCQKATGNFYAPLVSVRNAKLTWTRGEPTRFRSSNHVSRGFCEKCGTPLTYRGARWDRADDRGFRHAGGTGAGNPVGGERRMLPYVGRLHELPAHETMNDIDDAPYLRDLVSFQHPDHETDQWPPERK